MRKEMTTRDFPADTTLFQQGDFGSEMYVIQSGKVEISRRVGEREAVLAVLPSGEFFGEMAIINSAPRSANARVVEDARLLVLDSATFGRMIRDNSEIAIRLIKKLSHRLDQAAQQIELLMFRDPNSRIVHYLRQLAEHEGRPVAAGVAVRVTCEGLAEHLGLSEEEVAVVVARARWTGSSLSPNSANSRISSTLSR
ncbi:MAG: Crp/Fnr family transcriptional regulator [Deltaproteobacteria bacterium]|nr:Crp/Fnr family transcriptional regulator [Deltaproteobacteria bacterium]